MTGRRGTGSAALAWVGVTAAATAILVAARSETDQAHVVIIYLLCVLGGSVSGGRALGFSLAGVGFILIDYFFQPPYDTLTVGKPLDWVALLAFFATAAVTTQLLTRARTDADEARLRAEEVSSLAQLGAETLNAGRAEDALAAIAELIRSTLGVAECEIYRWDDDRIADQTVLRTAGTGPALPGWPNLELIAAVAKQPARSPTSLGTDDDGLVMIPVGPMGTTILIPLRGQKRPVGVVRISDHTPIRVDQQGRRRFLGVLAYYTALAVERVGLAAEAEHAEALRETDRMRDILIASLSHDLRTPLTTIKAAAQDGVGRGEPSAAIIEEQADLLTRLVGDLLDWSRIKSGAFPLNLEFNTAEDLIGAVSRLFSHRGGKPIIAQIDLESPALVGRFDFVQSLRILSNLVENAARFAPEGTAVDLGVSLEGRSLVFTVGDKGPGIPPEERRRIFEPFYRPIGAEPDVGRAGLGLSIASRLAEIQGGSLDFAPRPGGGSLFRLRLPAADFDSSLADSL